MHTAVRREPAADSRAGGAVGLPSRFALVDPPGPSNDPSAALRQFLVTAVQRGERGWNVFHHLGFLPLTSLQDKFPYYK